VISGDPVLGGPLAWYAETDLDHRYPDLNDQRRSPVTKSLPGKSKTLLTPAGRRYVWNLGGVTV